MSKHWLTVDNHNRINGCICGYQSTAAPDAYDYGDNVIEHIQHVTWEEGAQAGWNPESIGYRMHRAKLTNPYREAKP